MQFNILKTRFNVVAISLYLIPALMYLFITNLHKIYFYQESIFAIQASIFFAITGFLIGFIFSSKKKFKLKDYSDFFYINSAKFLIICGILSVSFQLIKYGIPVFNNNIREYIQQGVMWNIFTFSSIIGLFVSSYICFSLKIKVDIFFKVLIVFLFFLTFLTGWKGVLINYILIFFSYFIFYKKIQVILLFKIGFSFLLIFFGINALRSGIYNISFLELFNYLFYGFENFVRIAPSYSSDCLHSISLFGCPFVYNNDALINPTFNVYTALMPLYADGGVVLVGFIFFLFSFLLMFVKDLKNSFFVSFLFYLMHYFFIIGHNGYVFNSGGFVIALIVLFFVDVFRVK